MIERPARRGAVGPGVGGGRVTTSGHHRHQEPTTAGPPSWAPVAVRPAGHGFVLPPKPRDGPTAPPRAPVPNSGGRHHAPEPHVSAVSPEPPEVPVPRSHGGLFGHRRRRQEAEAENASLVERVRFLDAELAQVRAGAGQEITALRG